MSSLPITSSMIRIPSYQSLNQASSTAEQTTERNNVRNAVRNFFGNLFSCLPSRQQSSHDLHESEQSRVYQMSPTTPMELYGAYCEYLAGPPSSRNLFYLSPTCIY